MRTPKFHTKYIILFACLAAILVGIFIYGQITKPEMTYNDFVDAVTKGHIDEVILDSSRNFLQVKQNSPAMDYRMPYPKSDDFMDFLLSNHVRISYDGSGIGSAAGQIVLVIVIVGGIGYALLRRRDNSLIQNANSTDAHSVSLMLEDVAGNIEAKAMVKDIIAFIKNPEKYNKIGAKMPRGILFYGPPGTGKTLMAKAIAGEAGVPFYPMSGSDFMQMYVGVGASRVRDLFKTAKKSEKAVIFIDEIDAIGKKRSVQPNGNNDEQDRTLNALLTEMSGFYERDGVVVIAATNRLDILDEALTRPGRFDRIVEIGLPDVNARFKILELHSRSKNIAPFVDLKALSKSTVSFSGAMLESLLNEAAIFAANDSKSAVEPEHIDRAFYTVIAGAEKSDTSYITAHDYKITAYHEAGHALATKLLLPDSYISKVTIIPSMKGAGGFSLSIPKDTLYMTKQKMVANMKVFLAGRASEELIFGSDEITTGAANDIEKASGLVMDYMIKYGMDEEFGLFNANIIHEQSGSELTDLCRRKLKELYTEIKCELEQNLRLLHNIADALLEKESLSAEDMEALCSAVF